MFNGPEYASYIALCRELRLERDPFQLGDWLWDGWAKEPHCQISFAKLHAPPSRDVFWLPRLDQWLTMLEEATEPDDRMTGDEAEEFPCYAAISFERRWDGQVDVEIEWTWGSKRGARCEQITAPTKEEAAARLWMAVTK